MQATWTIENLWPARPCLFRCLSLVRCLKWATVTRPRATVKWTSDQVLRRLLPQGHVPEFTDPSGKVVLAEIPLAEAWIGHRVAEIEEASSGRVAYVSRLGVGFIPDASTVYQAGDFVHLVLARDDLAAAERVLDAAPPTH